MSEKKRLNCEPFADYLDSIIDIYDNTFYVFKFPNGFGAIVKRDFLEEYEIIVIQKNLYEAGNCWRIFDSVLINSSDELSEKDVHKCLKEIRDVFKAQEKEG